MACPYHVAEFDQLKADAIDALRKSSGWALVAVNDDTDKVKVSCVSPLDESGDGAAVVERIIELLEPTAP